VGAPVQQCGGVGQNRPVEEEEAQMFMDLVGAVAAAAKDALEIAEVEEAEVSPPERCASQRI